MKCLGRTRLQHIDDSSTGKDSAVTCTVTHSLTGIRSCKQLNKSDFVLLLKHLYVKLLVDKARFSCLVSSYSSTVENCSCLLDFSLTGGRLKSGEVVALEMISDRLTLV